MNVLVIPDVHLKPWIFDRAFEVARKQKIDQVVCLMDIPDDWGKEYNIGLYEETFDKAIWFQTTFSNTLWCYGNHDLSYLWEYPESGFSPVAIPVVKAKLAELCRILPDERQIAYIHKIDDVLFTHGGLTNPFVKYYFPDLYDDVDKVIEAVNMMKPSELWHEASPIWFRPQYGSETMYQSERLLQVVGHTPVREISRAGNIISCDVFSTYPDGTPIGTEEFLLIDTKTWEHKGIR